MTSLDINSELLAGIANFRSILQYCYKGQIAIQELSELTRYEGIKDVSPENTILNAILLNKNKSSITFIYRIKKTPYALSIWLTVSITCLFSVVFVCTCSLIIWKNKCCSKKEATVENIPIESTVVESEIIQIDDDKEKAASVIEWECENEQ